LDQGVDAVDQGGAGLAKQRREGVVPARKRAGMGDRRARAEFAAPELEHDQRLAARPALDRGAKPAPLPPPLPPTRHSRPPRRPPMSQAIPAVAGSPARKPM